MKLTYRKDYIAPAYRILTTDLDFTLDEEKTIVKSHMKIEKIKEADLLLNGARLKRQNFKRKRIYFIGKRFDFEKSAC